MTKQHNPGKRISKKLVPFEDTSQRRGRLIQTARDYNGLPKYLGDLVYCE
jgi:hypothetical protein